MFGKARALLGLAGTLPLRMRFFSSLHRGLSLPATFTVVGFVVVSLWVASLTGVERRIELNSRIAGHSDGAMYSIAVSGRPDTIQASAQSTLRLFEDGVELGPAHSPHVDIIAKGGGRFSHWDGSLLFSASDGSDVRSNGRRYTAIEAIFPPAWLIAAFVALWTAVFIADIRRRAGAIADIRGAHIAASLRESHSALIALGGLGLPLAAVVAVGTTDPGTAVRVLAQFRESVEWITAIGLAIGASLVLASHRQANPAIGAARFVAGAVLALVIIYGVLDRHYGLLDQTATMLWVFIAALAAALASRRAFPNLHRAIVEATSAALQRSPNWHVGLAIGASCALTFIQLLPDLVQYWDQSGWMDPDSYDRFGFNIARGASPAGDVNFPPAYQFGLAAVYWTFGHHFAVQQVFNLVLALLGVAALCLTAWKLYENHLAVWFAGLFAAHWHILHHATYVTQIEGWVVPLAILSLLALAHYFRTASLRAIAVLALAAGLLFAMRLQLTFYVAALGLAAVFVFGLRWRDRLRHLLTYGAIVFLVGVLPLCIRNYYLGGAFSPGSGQSAEFLAYLNDPRVPLYGIRYWQINDIVAEWAQRFPDIKERHAAMSQYFVDRLVHHPDYFLAAAPWRAAVFYGLLPWPVIQGTGTMEQFFSDPAPHMRATFATWAPILMSALGLLFSIRSRQSWFLLLLILSSVVIAFLVGFAEPRLCYPVMPIHMLMALAVLSPYARAPVVAARARTVPVSRWLRVLAVGALGIAATHGLVGRPNLYRQIKSASYEFQSNVAIDQTLPLVRQENGKLTLNGAPAQGLSPGQRYRVRVFLSNTQFSPKFAGIIDGIDPDLLRDRSVQHFYVYWTSGDNASPNILALRYDGVIANAPLKERMQVEAEVMIENVTSMYEGAAQVNWGRIEKAVVIRSVP